MHELKRYALLPRRPVYVSNDEVVIFRKETM